MPVVLEKLFLISVSRHLPLETVRAFVLVNKKALMAFEFCRVSYAISDIAFHQRHIKNTSHLFVTEEALALTSFSAFPSMTISLRQFVLDLSNLGKNASRVGRLFTNTIHFDESNISSLTSLSALYIECWDAPSPLTVDAINSLPSLSLLCLTIHALTCIPIDVYERLSTFFTLVVFLETPTDLKEIKDYFLSLEKRERFFVILKSINYPTVEIPPYVLAQKNHLDFFAASQVVAENVQSFCTKHGLTSVHFSNLSPVSHPLHFPFYQNRFVVPPTIKSNDPYLFHTTNNNHGLFPMVNPFMGPPPLAPMHPPPIPLPLNNHGLVLVNAHGLNPIAAFNQLPMFGHVPNNMDFLPLQPLVLHPHANNLPFHPLHPPQLHNFPMGIQPPFLPLNPPFNQNIPLPHHFNPENQLNQQNQQQKHHQTSCVKSVNLSRLDGISYFSLAIQTNTFWHIVLPHVPSITIYNWQLLDLVFSSSIQTLTLTSSPHVSRINFPLSLTKLKITNFQRLAALPLAPLTNLGALTLEHLTALSSLEIPTSLSSLHLEHLTIRDIPNMESYRLANVAFVECINLKTVVLPLSVSSLQVDKCKLLKIKNYFDLSVPKETLLKYRRFALQPRKSK